MMSAPASAAPGGVLPPLRDDLHLHVRGDDALIYDPLRHRFFQIPMIAANVLAHWDAGSVETLIGRIPGAGRAEVEALIGFLSESRLTKSPVGGGAALLRERERKNQSLPMRIVHNYLFFRLPLLRPEPMLDWLLPLAEVISARWVRWLIMFLGLLGAYLVNRQWPQFTDTFTSLMSLEGAAAYGLTMIVLKVFHELGHGLAARRNGCRVPVMGVAFMLLAPMLYTDVTDAWRLENRRDRFRIAAAGILVELHIAALALAAWAFLPPGPLRSASFFVSTAAIAGSLFINLSPFMRFDGYHMLADALGVDNLAPRAFALGRWKLREVLFAIGHEAPEDLSPALRGGLIAYAWATWVYRFFLFLGIGLLVYHLFPKAIGFPLLLIEIMYFIVRPVWFELRQWKGLSQDILASRRVMWLLGAMGLGLVMLALPLDRHVSVAAVLVPEREMALFAPEPAEVDRVEAGAGDRVRAGDVLLILRAPDLEAEARLLRIKISLAEARLNRIAADVKDRAIKPILERDLTALRQEQEGLERRLARLTLRAPFAGRVSQKMDGLAHGLWVGSMQELLEVVAEGGFLARGLVSEAEVSRIEPGALGVFVPEMPEAPAVEARLRSVGAANGGGREVYYLASTHGGPLPAEAGAEGAPRFAQAVFPVMAEVEERAVQARRGWLILPARPQSVLGQGLRRVAAVFLREAGT